MAIPPTQAPAAPPSGAADPSMEDILASIRRILSEDEAEPAAAAPAGPEPESESGVLTLDPSMLVEEPAAVPEAEPVARSELPSPAVQARPPEPEPQPVAQPEPQPAGESLIAPEAAAAAAASMGSLLRTLASERQHVAVYRGGPTIEDLVREEIRPLLKQWLDQNLPPLVERLVRVEIERVVGRALS